MASPCGRPPGPSINVQSCHIHTLSMIIQAFFHICKRRNKHYFFQCDSFSLEKVISQIQKYFYVFLWGSSGNALWYSNTSLLFSTNIVNHKRWAGTEQGLGQLSLSQLGNLANLVSAGNHAKLSLERFFPSPMSKTWDDDGGVQDDDGGAGDNNDVELSQWACDFPSFGKKRCFEANTLWTHCYTDCHTDSNAQPRCFLAAVLCVLRCEFNSEHTGVIAFWQKIFTLCTLAFEVFWVEQTGKGREGEKKGHTTARTLWDLWEFCNV